MDYETIISKKVSLIVLSKPKYQLKYTKRPISHNHLKAKSLDENSTARAKGFYSKFSRPFSETDMILE
jgi:hypothetical protein